MDPIITKLGTVSAAGQGYPVKAKSAGAHTLVASVVGAGAVELAGTLMGSNDLDAVWVKVNDVSATGTDSASVTLQVSGDYAYWRFDWATLTGFKGTSSISTDTSSSFDGGALPGAVALAIQELLNTTRDVLLNVLPTSAAQVNYAAAVRAAFASCQSGQTLMLPPQVGGLKYINCGGETITIPSTVNLGSHGAILYNAVIRFSPAMDQLKNSRVSNMTLKQCRVIFEETMYTGTSSGGNTATTFNDSAATWTPGKFSGEGTQGWWYVRIKSGTGTGQTKRITGNTSTQLTLSSAWTVNGGVIPDATSEYYFFCNLASITLDTLFFDGTNLAGGLTTSGNAIEVGNYAFNIRVLNSQVTHYAGAGYAQYGNSDKVANMGTANLGTGVFNIIAHSEIVNCGSGSAGGSGGGIIVKGGAQDGSTLHMVNVLLDGNQYHMYIDDSKNGDKDIPSDGSGGITVLAALLRCERGGRLAGGTTETSSIVNVRGNVSIDGLWIGTSLQTIQTKNIWHKSGKFVARGGRSTTPANIYDIYCEPGAVADWDVEMSNPYTIGALRNVKANETTGSELESLRIRIKRASATSATYQILGGNGLGWGAGGAAGDRWSSSESAPANVGESPPLVASPSVGTGFSQAYGYVGAGGGTFTFTLNYKQIAKILAVSIVNMNAGLTNIYADAQLLNGTANFSIIFRDNLGVEKNVVSQMADGKYIDVQVMFAISR